MSKSVPSIGESGKALQRIRKQEPLPSTREEVVHAFANILAQGAVQKVTVELGKPIVYERLVSNGELPDIQELPDEDLFAETRNAEMFELREESKSFFQLLYFAFQALASRSLKPTAFIFSTPSELNKALGESSFALLKELFSVPVQFDSRLPSKTGLLVGSTSSIEKSVALSIKIVLE